MSLLRDTRGLALVEALVALPAFISIFLGLVVIHRVYSAKLDAMTEARECAWLYANGGCESLPPKCKVVDVRGVGLEAIVESNAQAASRFDEALGQAGAKHSSGGLSDTAGAIGDLGALGTRLMGLGNGFTAIAEREYELPPFYGGGKKKMNAGYSLVCNEKKMDLMDLVEQFYCAFTGEDGKC